MQASRASIPCPCFEEESKERARTKQNNTNNREQIAVFGMCNPALIVWRSHLHDDSEHKIPVDEPWKEIENNITTTGRY
jgi:hypothetical protein